MPETTDDTTLNHFRSESDFLPPVQRKPSNMRYFWLAIIILLVASVVGVGAYLIDSENKKLPEQIASLLTPTPELPKPTITPTPMDVWRTYTSPKSGYSLKYPKSFKQESTSKDTLIIDTWTSPGAVYTVSIFNFPSDTNTTLDFGATIESTENIFIAGQKVKKIVGTETTSDVGTLIHVGPLTASDHEYMIVFNSGTHVADAKSLEVFSQILSTIAFSEIPSVTASPSGKNK